MTEKTAVYQDGKLIGYCDEISLKTDFDNTHFAITGFSPTDRQPTFAVGEYYVSNDGDIYKITSQENLLISIKMYSKSSGRFLDMTIPSHDPQDKPATAEQKATFKRAEHFASKGRKLDEFRVGDKIKLQSSSTVITVESITDKYIDGKNSAYQGAASVALGSNITLIQTAEELQEVGDGKDREN